MSKSLANAFARAVAMVVGVACLISLESCRSRIADPEMPEWDLASIEAVLRKPNLRVLDIGNIYTNDAVALLSQLVNDVAAFKAQWDVILANRFEPLLADVEEKAYYRDPFRRD